MGLLTALKCAPTFGIGEPIIVECTVLEISPSQMVNTAEFCKRDTPFDDVFEDIFAILQGPVRPPEQPEDWHLRPTVASDPYAQWKPPDGWRNSLPAAPFVGMVVERPPPGPADTLSIPPGEMVSTRVNLCDGCEGIRL